MAVTYTETGYTLIERGLRDIINDEFQNVYVSNEYQSRGSESIRINLNNSTNLMSLPTFEQRVFDIEIRYYFVRNPVNELEMKNIKNKADRLAKHLKDNMVGTIGATTHWVDLIIEQITYGVEDEENEDNNLYIIQYDLTLTNHITI